MARSFRHKKKSSDRSGISAKTRKRIRVTVLFMLLGAVVVTGFWLYTEWRHYQRAIRARFPEFGIAMPSHHAIHGIDVSRYQRYVSWSDVSAMNVLGIKLGFCFIKATEGTGYTDPHFSRNWKKSKQAGMIRGAYHYFSPTASGLTQARHFLSAVRFSSGDMPPVLDLEETAGVPVAHWRKEALLWLTTVEKATGIQPILYTNVSFYRKYLGRAFDKYPLWVAHYYQPRQPSIFRGWTFWQHSDAGRVNGIEGPVDFNVFNGDSSAFRRILIP
ncbi:MAG: glycoside hydrolase family 25 protein [Sphingomonadales bacterium]